MYIVEFSEKVACNFKTCLRGNWPEYLMEAAAIGVYLFFTCLFATLFQHPNSPIHQIIPCAIVRRALMGIAVAATVVVIALTPWGKRSGGHINPAMTFAFYRLGKVDLWDAVFYGVSQFGGAATGVAAATYLFHGAPGNETARYAATLPGKYGSGVAFIAEATISFSLMLTVLFVSNHEPLARYTPYFVGVLYALFITFETPLSGMSMNPARTFGPALQAGHWHAVWIYFLGPTLGMLLASEVFLWARNGIGPYCAKLHHANGKRCIFRHGPLQVRS
jgi:aquaporin Z